MNSQRFGITTKKEENFSEWYQQVVIRSEILDYYDVRGCFIMRPPSMFMWGEIRKRFDSEISKLGVEECYFPMLVTKKNLEQEKSHLANFDPELAWITRCGDKVIDDPVAVRPTSETIIYPSYAKWIKTYRDLPLKMNQWCSVLRWEVKSTLPFIRGREFLWQEGHTAFYNEEEAKTETHQILDIYARIYEEMLAVPVTKGMKSKNETFGGAVYTLSVEAFIHETGKGVQAATSHYLGQNFAKIFEIKVETDMEDSEKRYAHQNSWGMTTRSLGIAIMVHSDNRGLVCPPYVAQIQAVIVLCGVKASTTQDEKIGLEKYVSGVYEKIRGTVRTHYDDRAYLTPGFKYNYWELRGVPLRIEIGLRDMANHTVCVVRRDTGKKENVSSEHLAEHLVSTMAAMHSEMYKKALAARDNQTRHVDNMDELKVALNSQCQAVVPWCLTSECEDEITEKTTVRENGEVVIQGAKSLCIPLDLLECKEKQCVNCRRTAVKYTLVGRSY
ncbi:bifunctional glutamyl/prolyl-tRNA synthetase [Pancytospora epiphaga]|nr:bifunctional glutamyl/prolyl-tRNA synthetase [Pancytospora epiphaga]